jgi:transketolase
MEIKDMQLIAKEIRKDIIEMIYRAKSGHPGGSLSITDIMTVLYWKEMNIDPANPKMANRDRFVLSKGHAAPALYGTLMEKGYIDKKYVTELRKYGSPLQGHPDMKKLNGVEMSTGSLGQAMTTAHYKLDNVVAIVDYNNLQIDGKVSDVMEVYPIADKFRAFNWHVIEIDGHNYEQIIAAFDEARTVKGKPTVIVAKTAKGKGVSFMENNGDYHGKAPSDDEYARAMEELK